jgi:hypothetical protein
LALSRDSRAEKKLKALRRAEFRLKQRFEFIDWEEDFLYKEIETLKSGGPLLGMKAGDVFDLKVVDAHKRLGEVTAEPAGHAGSDRGAADAGGGDPAAG